MPESIPEAALALLRSPDILAEFASDVERAGVVGEQRAGKLLYLCVTSRLLSKPVSAKVEGPSAGGKSNVVNKTFDFFPEDAFYKITGMSEKTLIYSNEDFRHRTLLIAESNGINGEFMSYLLRSLLSEGRIDYDVVVTMSGAAAVVDHITKEGPTNLVLTTVALQLEAQLETRLLSVPIDDTWAQTLSICEYHANVEAGNIRPGVDYGRWHAVQKILTDGDCKEVLVPFATRISAMLRKAKPADVRLRRDFPEVLVLIKAHALLHQMNRETDDQGRIVATLRDYEAVYNLVHDLVASGTGTAVSRTMRETVEAVKNGEELTYTEIGKRLGLEATSSAKRRVDAAVQKGYLVNRAERQGTPARIIRGEPLPEDGAVLPTPRALADELRANLQACANPTANPKRRSEKGKAPQFAGLQPNRQGRGVEDAVEDTPSPPDSDANLQTQGVSD